MTLPFKPHLIALVPQCRVMSLRGNRREKPRPEAPAQAAAPAPEPTQTAVPAPVAKRPLPLRKSITGRVPVALYPYSAFAGAHGLQSTRRTGSGRPVSR